MEVADAVAGMQILRLARRPRQRGPEEPIGVGGQRPQELGHRAVVHEIEHSLLPRRVRLAGPRFRDGGVPADGQPQPGSGASQRDATRRREGEQQRHRLDRAAGDDAAAHLRSRQPAGYGPRLHAGCTQQRPGRRGGATEDVRTEVQPDVAARLRPQPAAGPLTRLEHDDVAVAQLPACRQPREPATDDHDLALLDIRRAQTSTPITAITRPNAVGSLSRR